MSRITEKDIELMNYWETELVDWDGFEYKYNWPAFCKKCWWSINTFSDKEICPNCKAFIT